MQPTLRSQRFNFNVSDLVKQSIDRSEKLYFNSSSERSERFHFNSSAVKQNSERSESFRFKTAE